LPPSSLHEIRAPHKPGRVVANQIRKVCGSMLIHGGTKPPVVGPPESSVVQVAPRSLDRTTNSGPWSTLVGGAALFGSSGAYSTAPDRVTPTAADSLVCPITVRHG